MIIRQIPVELTLNYSFGQEYDPEKIVFFDIETTGFAAETTYLYLIGCIYQKDASFQMIQWFSEDIREEQKLISLFFEFLKNYEVLIHYNGDGFDIPYLLKKCALYRLKYDFAHMKSIDIYKKIAPVKKLFKLRNYKQKSIEAFLNIHREDTFDGGDLIQVYQSYLGKKRIETLKKSRKSENKGAAVTESAELLKQLLLHNEDDLKGLVGICPILHYTDLPDKPIRILQAGVDGNVLAIRFEVIPCLPVRVSCGSGFLYFTAYENSACLNVDTYEGELKYFYDNYKDYYYLPEEDTAIHKSLALYVDKEFRQKAKPSTCYIKKQGLFAPQYAPVISPGFKKDFHDKLTFLEIHTDFLLQEKNLEQYVLHLFNHLLTSKA